MSSVMVGGERVYIREFFPERDIPLLVDIPSIDESGYWTTHKLECLRDHRNNCFIKVADTDYDVPGFVVYQFQGSRAHVIDVAVHPQWVQRGLHLKMIEWMVSNLLQGKHKELVLYVRDRNKQLQISLRERAFWAIRILPNHYANGDSAYWMRFHRDVPGWVRLCNAHQWYNRVSQYYRDAA